MGMYRIWGCVGNGAVWAQAVWDMGLYGIWGCMGTSRMGYRAVLERAKWGMEPYGLRCCMWGTEPLGGHSSGCGAVVGAEPRGCLHHTVCEAIRAAWGVEAHGVPGHIACAPCSMVHSTTRWMHRAAVCSKACSAVQPAGQRAAPYGVQLSTLQRAGQRATPYSVQHPTACSTALYSAPHSTIKHAAQHQTAGRAACNALRCAAQHPTAWSAAPYFVQGSVQHRPARWAPARSPLWEQHQPAPSPCSRMGTPRPSRGWSRGVGACSLQGPAVPGQGGCSVLPALPDPPDATLGTPSVRPHGDVSGFFICHPAL